MCVCACAMLFAWQMVVMLHRAYADNVVSHLLNIEFVLSCLRLCFIMVRQVSLRACAATIA